LVLFKQNNGKLQHIKESPFELEKKIQKITEDNLKQIFDLEFVKSEFQVTSEFRIDTLAFDKESSSFVIIEYKNGRDKGLMTQGLAYLSTMLDRHSDFITEYNERLNKNLKKTDVDKSQSKIIFISSSFDKNIIQASNLDLPIELWKVQLYENNMIQYLSISRNSKTSTKLPKFSGGGTFEKITRELKTYDEEYHYNRRTSAKTKHLYQEIKKRILLLDNNIELIIRKKYIAFKTNYNFVYINLKKSLIHVDISMKQKEVEDPKNLIRNMEGIGHYGAGSSRITITDESDIPYMMGLVEQSYSKSMK
jgi:predicted transport protein